MKKIFFLLKSQYKLVNFVVGLIGIILVLLGNIPIFSDVIKSVLLSIGCSLIATCLATWISSYYILESSEKSHLLLSWKCNNIYETKSLMNNTSNNYLDKAKTNIDIVATGMANFLNVKGDLLEKKAKSGVSIRIISCGNLKMLFQRERDESLDFEYPSSCKMELEVIKLSEWVEKISNNNGKLEIKYLDSYPSFSYLRIDNNLFFGPNLPLYKSQQNCAIEFDIMGKGGEYFSNYFEKLWSSDNTICSKELSFRRRNI